MKFDVIIIGSGPGGYVGAIRASQLGLKVAVVERENLGGICLNWGCIPTKALLKSAQVFEYMKHAEDYGISIKEAKPDFPAMITRSRGVADGMSKGIQFLLKKNRITVLEGHGELQGAGKVGVKDTSGKMEIHEATHILLACGGRAKTLSNVPVDGEKIIEYRKAMTLSKQPKRMVIVGAGAIGVEFAYLYNAIGTEVTLVEFLEQGMLPREDAEVSREMTKIFTKKGINVLGNTAVERVDTGSKEIRVTIRDRKSGKESEIQCDVVLSAAGISPNIENIGLEKAGVLLENGLIKVDAFYRTNVPGIYAIGDIIPGPALAHVASAEAIICVEKIAGQETHPLDYANIPSCTYCSPEVASVGMTEEEARKTGHSLKIGKFPFSASGKASAGGDKSGFVKLLFEEKYGELLGAHMVGQQVTEMIAEIVAIRKLETTGHELIKTVHPHPTMSEAIMEAAAAAYGEVIHL